MTTNHQHQSEVAGILADLKSAQENFEGVGHQMEAARRYLQDQRSRLNEGWFQSKCRELGEGSEQLPALVAHQNVLRFHYMTGRLALEYRYDQLKRRGEALVRQVARAGSALEIPRSLSEQQALSSACFWSADRLEDSSRTAQIVMDNDLGKDLTDGQAQESMCQLFWALCREGRSVLQTKRKDPTNCENHCWFIPLSEVDQTRTHFKHFVDVQLNDELVALGDAFNALADHNSYVEAWNGYEAVKYNLNEPQYADRFRQAAGNDGEVNRIRDELRGRQAAYLCQRVSLDNLHRRLREMKEKALDLSSRIQGSVGPYVVMGNLIAMSNVLNANEMANWIDLRMAAWTDELSKSSTKAAVCGQDLSAFILQKVTSVSYSSFK